MKSSRRVFLSGAAIIASLFVLLIGVVGPAQAAPPSPQSSEPEVDQLAGEVDDPTAILTQLKLQDLFTPSNFHTSAETNTVQVRPVLSVAPPPFLSIEQIIRPTFKFETLATSSGSSTINEFADTELFDLFVPQWPNPKETGLGWGVGPTFIFPTGRVSQAGDHAWELGPAAAAVYRGIPHLMVGFLFQNPISFAYTNSSATPKSEMEFQPLISYTLGDGWYVKSADSTWTVEWRHNKSTTLPISLGVGRVWKTAGPELDTWISGEWTAYQQFEGITPMYTVRFGLTLFFPHIEL